jgi:Sulfotransferase family
LRAVEKNAPDFFILGAQKAGTTWLWSMLEQHPGTSLPEEKEIHYFGSSELYAKGDDWYYSHFRQLDPNKLIGEASTSHFYDSVPYWYNKSDQIEFDKSLPTIPELMLQKFPDAKFIVVIRDPVHRAISAYSHWMKQGELSPLLGLKRVATEHPKLRILEYGYYAKYLNLWMKATPSDRFRIIIFEDQIRKNWDRTLTDTYAYLGLDPTFSPELPSKPVHRSWGWTRIVFNYYAGKIFKGIGHSRVGKLLDRFDFLANSAIKAEDIEFLQSVYLPEKEAIAKLTGNQLSCWDYGDKLLQQLQSKHPG